MAKPSKAARACISREIRKHYKKGKPRGQAAAIAYSVCERKGFRSIKRRSSSQLREPGSTADPDLCREYIRAQLRARQFTTLPGHRLVLCKLKTDSGVMTTTKCGQWAICVQKTRTQRIRESVEKRRVR